MQNELITYPNTNSSNSNLAEFRSKTRASQYIGFAGIFEFLLQRHGCDVSTTDHIILYTTVLKNQEVKITGTDA